MSNDSLKGRDALRERLSDEKCHALAEYFLSDRHYDNPKHKAVATNDLAHAIQNRVEDWFYDVDNR